MIECSTLILTLYNGLQSSVALSVKGYEKYSRQWIVQDGYTTHFNVKLNITGCLLCDLVLYRTYLFSSMVRHMTSRTPGLSALSVVMDVKFHEASRRAGLPSRHGEQASSTGGLWEYAHNTSHMSLTGINPLLTCGLRSVDVKSELIMTSTF